VQLSETGTVLLAADAVMHHLMAAAATRQMFVTDREDKPGIRRSMQKLQTWLKAKKRRSWFTGMTLSSGLHYVRRRIFMNNFKVTSC